jgi:dihydrofolate reductase
MINLIAAYDNKFGIGLKNKMPWHIKEEMQIFKELTTENTVVFGRNTFESVGLLPHRKNVVISKTYLTSSPNVFVYPSLKKYIRENPDENIFICGGAKLYESAIREVDIEVFYLSRIHGEYVCDCFFPVDAFTQYIRNRNFKFEVLKKEKKFTTIKLEVNP